MSASNSRLAYPDCYALFDKALADPNGIRYKCKDLRTAQSLQSRLHYARTLDRKDNREVYEEGDPLFGRSSYDVLKVTVRKSGDHWYVYIAELKINSDRIESLEGVGDAGI